MESVKHFSYFLYGRRFKLITDHKGLSSLRSGRQLNRRVYGWALTLAEFDFELKYRSGSQNVVADDLSRCHVGCSDGVTRHLEAGGDVGLGPAKAHMIREKEDENEKEMREDREREKDV